MGHPATTVRRPQAAPPPAGPAAGPEEQDPSDPPLAVDPPVPEAFTVRTRDDANYLVRRVRACRAYAKDVAEYAAAECRRAEAEERHLLERYGGQLEAWARAQLEAAGGRGRRLKSVALPAGRLCFRSEPPRLDVADGPAVLAWCRRHLPAALKLSVEVQGGAALRLAAWVRAHCPEAQLAERVAKSVLNAHAEQTGELPEGTCAGGGGERFYIK